MNQLTNFLTEPLLLGLIWSLLALGVFVAYRVLNIADLSVEGVLPLSAIVGIWAINAGMNCVLALLLSVLIGVISGIITASLHVFCKIPTLLAGIIMMTGLLTFVVLISKGNISLDPSKVTIFTFLDDAFKNINSSQEFIPWATWISSFIIVLMIVVICVILLYVFFGTNLGISIRATGKNQTMAKACGINVNMMIIIGLAISSGLIGLAGGVLGQHQTYASSTMGEGTIVIGLATLFLGEVIVGRRSFKINLISIIVGAFVYWYIIDAIQLIPNFNTVYLYLVQAILMIVVMVIPYIVNLIKGTINKKKAREQNA